MSMAIYWGCGEWWQVAEGQGPKGSVGVRGTSYDALLIQIVIKSSRNGTVSSSVNSLTGDICDALILIMSSKFGRECFDLA